MPKKNKHNINEDFIQKASEKELLKEIVYLLLALNKEITNTYTVKSSDIK